MKIKTKKFALLMILMTLLSIIFTACGPDEPTVDIDAQRTGFAQTADVQATMTVEARPTATETPEPSPTFTNTPDYTPTPEVTATETNNEVAPPIGGTDGAVLIAQEPSDNTAIKPGDPFTVTWTLENTGTSTWTTNYYIVFASGEQMGAVEKVFAWLPVPPGTSLTFTVNFTAPGSEGTYQSNWKISNANDFAFSDFNIVIVVSDTAESAPDAPSNTQEPVAEEP